MVDNNKKELVKNFFYEKPSMIPNNIMHKWFEDGQAIHVVTKTGINGTPITYDGELVSVSSYEIVVREVADNTVRIIYKSDISSIRKYEEPKKK